MMTKEQVKYIVDKAKALDAFDTIVVTSDNADILYTKAEGTIGIFNDGQEMFETFRVAVNPNRVRDKDRNFSYECLPYSDIVTIEFFPERKGVLDNKVQLGEMEEKQVTDIISLGSGQFQVSGFLRDKETGESESAKSFMPSITLGMFENESKLYKD